MIEKMTKYNFILLNEEQEVFLQKLQEMGVVDITRSTKPVDESSSQMLEKAEELKRAKVLLETVQFENIKPEEIISSNPVSDAFQIDGELKELEKKIEEVNKEIAERLPWGDFDKSQLESLEALGYKIRYYHVSDKTFNPYWENIVPLQVIRKEEKDVWFVTVSDDPEYLFPVNEIQKPEGSVSESTEELARLEASQKDAQAKLLGLKSYASKLDSQYSAALSDLDRYLATKVGTEAAEGYICIFEGFAPSEETDRLVKEFDEMGVYYLCEEAKEEDNPPIKLRNNKFTKMFESLTGMYGMPVYGEWDPTPILGVFFMLFFAMCMGDGGYGIILMIYGILQHRKIVNIDMFDGIGNLIATLGVATTVVGLLFGTFFGVDLTTVSWIPEGIKNVMLAGDINIAGSNYAIQMILAICIGVFHISLAMVIKAILYTQRFGFKKNIATWGWVLLIVGGLIVTVCAMCFHLPQTLTKVILITIAVISALGIYLFNTPGRNPVKNIGPGLWETYNMATGILGDVLSYIRLYALGLAGGMLGNAFNILGGLLLGEHPTWQFLPFALIMLFGHTLNMLMSCLGAFVHPLRLTFVEYFKNSGYEGKGTAYNPLKKS